MDDNNYYGQGGPDSPQMDMQPGQMYSTPSGSVPMYGNGQASLTDMRTSYGANMPGMLAYGAASGISVVGHGAYTGASRMMADLGGMVRPISYTPQARVYTGYSGRVQQETSFFGSMSGSLGFKDAPRGTSPYLYSLNASADFGERVGGAASGVAVSAATIGAAQIGASLGGALFGGAGMLAGSLGGYAVGGFAADKIYEGIAARRQTQDYLERTSSTYIGSGSRDADPRTGAGFSRDARREVGEFIRSLDVGDKMMGGEDLQSILKKSTELGMFSGTQGVQDFKKKFKSIVENLKVVTTTLNQTLEEGLQTMKELKGAGISESAAGGIAFQAQAFGKMSGRTALEMVNIGLQGAEIFRGTGVNMSIGVQSNMMNVASIRASRDAGLISQEAIAQAGGEEALAQRMTGTSLAFTQSQIGRGHGAVYVGQGGGFDQQAFLGALGGNMGIGDAALQAARNLGSPKAMIEYQVNQEKFRNQQAKMAGGAGLEVGMMSSAMIEASTLASNVGINMDTATQFILQNRGMGRSEIDATMAKIRDPKAFFDAQQKATQASYNQAMMDASIRNSPFHRLGESIGDMWKSVADPISAPLNRMTDSAAEGWQDFVSSKWRGMERFSEKGLGVAAFRESMALTQEQIAEATSGKTDMTRWTLPGTTTAGSDLAKRLLELKLAGTPTSASVHQAGYGGKDKDVVLSSLFGVTTSISNEEFSKLQEEYKVAGSVTLESAKALRDSKALDSLISPAQGKLTELIGKGGGLGGTFSEFGEKLFGTKSMSPAQYSAALVVANTAGLTKYVKMAEADHITGEKIAAAANEKYVVSQKYTAGVIADAEEELGVKGLIANDTVRSYFVKGITAKTQAERAAAFAQAEAESVKSGGAELTSSADWKGLKQGNLSASQIAAAERIAHQQGVLSARKVLAGGDLFTASVGSLLEKDNVLSEDQKKEVLGLTASLTGFAGGDVALKLVADKDKYEKVKDLLSKSESGQGTKVLLEQADAATRLHALPPGASILDQKAALTAANIGSGDQDVFLKQYSERGMNMVQESYNKKFAGDKGDDTMAVANPGTTPQDVLVLQTSLNQATLSAFMALASKLKAIP